MQRSKIQNLPFQIFAQGTVLISVLMCLMCYPTHAEADGVQLSCRDRPEKEGRITTLAGDLFARGERAFSEKQYAKALKRFLCSLYVFEHEATLTNIKEIVRFVEPPTHAAALIEDYATLNPEGRFTEELKALAETLKQGADASSSTKKDTVDESPPPPAPPKKVCVTLRDPAPFIAHAESQQRLSKILGFTTLGIGAVTLIAGAALEGLALGLDDRFQTGGIVGLAAGTLVTGVGIAQVVLAVKQQKKLNAHKSIPKQITQCNTEEAPKVDARLAPGPGSLQLTLRF